MDGRGQSWFVKRPDPGARLRLFCFPHAGLGASVFRSWVGALGPAVDVMAVQLPGRESRQFENPFRRMPELCDAAAAALQPYLDVPFALFGHSMGGAVAFEVASRLREHRGLQRLFVSARRAPHLRDPLPPACHLTDPEFVGVIQHRYAGIPQEVLDSPGLLELLLPRLRADFELLETYHADSPAALPCPLSVFGGIADTTVSRSELQAWAPYSAGPFRVRMIDGGHLYLQAQRNVLVSAIAEDLGSPCVTGPEVTV
jgi:medium-chain acyl-[acyl-carrier-protein] hydrolase